MASSTLLSAVWMLAFMVLGTRVQSFKPTSPVQLRLSTKDRNPKPDLTTANVVSGLLNAAAEMLSDKPTPPVWPDKFKATLFQNRTSRLALTYLYYDWKLGANLNLIANQLGQTIWDLEWNNGTSFIFSRDEPVCKVLQFDVGILTPDWLNNSTHLGQTETDTFVVDVWTKADFINYYASVDTGLPVRWTFLSSKAEFHVMSFEEGVGLSKHLWQAPHYCFQNGTSNSSSPTLDDQPLANGQMYRLKAAKQSGQEVQHVQLHEAESFVRGSNSKHS